MVELRKWLIAASVGLLAIAGFVHLRTEKTRPARVDAADASSIGSASQLRLGDFGVDEEAMVDAGRSSICARPTGDAAHVDDMTISVEALCARLARLGSIDAGVEHAQARAVLDQLIDAALVKRALERENATVTESEVTSAIVALGVDAGSSVALREQVRERVEMQKLSRMRGKVDVTEDEVRAEMAKGAPAIDRGQGIRVQAWIARFPPGADAAVQADAQRSAEDFAKAVHRETPDAAAAQHHMAPLAPFVVGSNGVEPELEHAAFNLKAGEWSDPIRTRVGWTVLRVVERVEPREMNEDLLRARVRLALENQKLQKSRDDLVASMRALARIDVVVRL
jgi:parvulin-like peptidyl-prolyl isomerase